MAGTIASNEVAALARGNASNESHSFFLRSSSGTGLAGFGTERNGDQSGLAAVWAFKNPVRVHSSVFAAMAAPGSGAQSTRSTLTYEELMYWVRHRWDAARVPARARALHLVSSAAEWALAAAISVYFLSFAFEMRVSTLYAPEFQYVYVCADKSHSPGSSRRSYRRCRLAPRGRPEPLHSSPANSQSQLVEDQTRNGEQQEQMSQQPPPAASPTPSTSSIYPAQSPPPEAPPHTRATLIPSHSA